MYKYVVVACCLVALCAAAPQNPQDVQIVKYDNDVSPEGYQFAFDTSDGTSRQEQGQLQNIGTDNESLNVQGSYSYVAPDGKTYTVTFTAGENGFQPRTHLGQ